MDLAHARITAAFNAVARNLLQLHVDGADRPVEAERPADRSSRLS